MSYLKVNLNRPAELSAGAGSGKNRVIIVDADDVLVYPPRDNGGVKLNGNFVMKSNAKMYEFYTTKSKADAPVEADGDEDSITMKQMFNAQHPGNGLPVKEFVQNWLSRNCYVLHQSCGDDYWEVVGTPCAPVQLKPSKQDNNDARFWSLKFEAFAKSRFIPGHYEGEIIFTNPFAVVSATSVIVNTTTNSQYRLPSTASATSVAFNSTITAEDGDIITLIGGGGATAATLAQVATGNTQVLLKSGTTWTALDGAVIQFEIFKAGAVTLFMELSRG
jgi:hypothetical protein